MRHEYRQATRAVGAGTKHRLVFVDRLLAILVDLRYKAPHDVLACRSAVDRSLFTRTVGAVRPCSPSGGTIGLDVHL